VEEKKPLQTWKEIAEYLSVSVRTAQIYEKEMGLPIERIGKGPKARVIADPQRIDEWLKQRQNDNKLNKTEIPISLPSGEALHESSISVEKSGTTASSIGMRFRENSTTPKLKALLIRILPYLTIFIAMLLVALFFLIQHREPRIPSSVELTDSILKVKDLNGNLLFSKTFRNLSSSLYSSLRQNRQYLISDINQDSDPEILFNYTPANPLTESEITVVDDLYGKLLCFSRKGSLLWEHTYGRERFFQGRIFSQRYIGRLILPFIFQETSYVLAVTTHNTFFPCQISLLNAMNGELVGEYWHPGWINSALIWDFDHDAQPEILLGGINNPGEGLGYPALLLVKPPLNPPTTITESGSDGFLLNSFSGGGEIRYYLLPRPDIADIDLLYCAIENLSLEKNGLFKVKIVTKDDVKNVDLFYTMDRDFCIVDLEVSSLFWSLHQKDFTDHKLNHPFSIEEKNNLKRMLRFPTAPNGNSLEIRGMWHKKSANEH